MICSGIINLTTFPSSSHVFHIGTELTRFHFIVNSLNEQVGMNVQLILQYYAKHPYFTKIIFGFPYAVQT